MNWRAEMLKCLEYMTPALSQTVASLSFRSSGFGAADQTKQVSDALVVALALRATLTHLDVQVATRQFIAVERAYYTYCINPALDHRLVAASNKAGRGIPSWLSKRGVK